MARKFLYFIAICIALIFAVFLTLRLFPEAVSRFALVPSEEYAAPKARSAADYRAADLWFSRPGLAKDPSRWLPTNFEVATEDPTQDPGYRPAAVFFIHPTSYLNRAHWNEPVDEAESRDRAISYLKMMASAFTTVGPVWAPRYRQATLGAFLTEQPEGQKALGAAYADVLAAFDAFVAAQPADMPILLAGHSQGSMHLSRLLKDRVAGQPLAKRIIAAYIIGWPVPVTADLPAMGLPACTRADQAGCILSYQSFAEPAGYGDSMALFEALPGLTGRSRRGDTYLCTNPLTGQRGGAADAARNLGMVKPSALFDDGSLVTPGVGAKCDAKGFLLIGPGPDLGPFVLPNNNYHAYDYPLFWQNLRADAARRLRAFAAS